MRIKSNTRAEIARLFSCLQYGEMLAHDCAVWQSRIPDASVHLSGNRFFMRQARQELHHARVFNRVVLVITPRGATPVPDSLRQYRARLKSAYRKGRLVETLVGQQIVLEEFGALILQRLDTKFDQRRLGFKRIRKILLHQEQGHIAFGARAVRGLIEMGEARLEEVEELVSEYMDLIDQTIDGLQPMFEVIGADAQLYKNELRRGLPDWCEVSN